MKGDINTKTPNEPEKIKESIFTKTTVCPFTVYQMKQHDKTARSVASIRVRSSPKNAASKKN